MRVSRTTSAALVVATAMPWAVLMVVGGIWLLTRGTAAVIALTLREPGSMLGVVQVGGVFWLAAGQLLFMSLVADRLFPRASRRLVAPFEIVTTVVLFSCVAWLVVLMVQALMGQGG